MTREEFIKVLEGNGYSSYEIVGDKIVVTHVTRGGYVNLDSLTSLPPGVEFRNRGHVYLRSLTSLPPGVEFNNGGGVTLKSLTSLPLGVEFENEGYVYLESLETISRGVEFKNGGDVRLKPLIGVSLHEWSGNIEGIDSKMLLNLMIKQGVFI